MVALFPAACSQAAVMAFISANWAKWLIQMHWLEFGECVIWIQLYNSVTCIVTCVILNTRSIYKKCQLWWNWLIVQVVVSFHKTVCFFKAIMRNAISGQHHPCCWFYSGTTVSFALFLTTKLHNQVFWLELIQTVESTCKSASACL